MNKLFKRLSNNNDGVVFITVLMIIIMMMTLTVTVLNINVSSVQGSETEYRRIQAVELAKGVIYYHVAREQVPPPVPNSYTLMPPITLDGNTFSVNVNKAPGAGIDGTSTLNILTTY